MPFRDFRINLVHVWEFAVELVVTRGDVEVLDVSRAYLCGEGSW